MNGTCWSFSRKIVRRSEPQGDMRKFRRMSARISCPRLNDPGFGTGLILGLRFLAMTFRVPCSARVFATSGRSASLAGSSRERTTIGVALLLGGSADAVPGDASPAAVPSIAFSVARFFEPASAVVCFFAQSQRPCPWGMFEGLFAFLVVGDGGRFR